MGSTTVTVFTYKTQWLIQIMDSTQFRLEKHLLELMWFSTQIIITFVMTTTTTALLQSLLYTLRTFKGRETKRCILFTVLLWFRMYFATDLIMGEVSQLISMTF